MTAFPMKTIRTACAATALFACGGGHQKHQLTASEMIAADPLPLKKGAKWTYEVTVKRFDVDTDRETLQKMPWTIEVVEAREANGISAYRVKGWPSDQSDFQAPAQANVEKTLLRHGNSFLFGATPEPTLEGAAGWFSWPVIDGQKICPSAENVYCWQVSATDNGYALALYAGSDEQTFDLEPAVGVSRFHFKHHGPTNEVDAKLVSYTTGK
jgi:hypothetical protein